MVGMAYGIPGPHNGYFLEGDPLFTIDSDATRRVGYTGTEDFFDGGWFFSDGPMRTPLVGCTQLYSNFYRLFLMDAVDFSRSFDLVAEHGAFNRWVGEF